MRTSTAASAVFSVLLVVNAAPFAAGSASPVGTGGLTFDSEEARRVFNRYVEFLVSNPTRFERHIATIQRLQASDIHFCLVMVDSFSGGIEGRLTTDGRTVFIHLTHVGGPAGEIASMNSRLAHELEHARQFDCGEIAFTRDPLTGRWGPSIATYDIGDDVKAWEAQLEASVGFDFFEGARSSDDVVPSLLNRFAKAVGFEERARVLMANGYKDLRPVGNANVLFGSALWLLAGTIVRPEMKENFFGRVHGIPEPSVAVRR